MADVQIENGHIKIANRIFEALIYAEFTGAQSKILDCLIRVSWGWRRKTIKISRSKIASLCHLKETGGFRRAFDELIEHKVILVCDAPIGSRSGEYAVNKNFEDWGRFSVAERTLETLFRRPRFGAKNPEKSEDRNAETPPLSDEDFPPDFTAPTGAPTTTRQKLPGAPTGAVSTAPTGAPTTAPTGAPGLLVSDDTKGVPTSESKERKESNTTTASSSSADTREIERDLSAQLSSDLDRRALAQILDAAPDRTSWVFEIQGALTGINSICLSVKQLGEAMRDYVAAGNLGRPLALKHFRSYLQRAKLGGDSNGAGGAGPPRNGSNGPKPTPQQFTYSPTIDESQIKWQTKTKPPIK